MYDFRSGFPYTISTVSELYIGYVYNSPQAISQGGDLVLMIRTIQQEYTVGNGSINIAQPDGIYQYTYEAEFTDNRSSSPLQVLHYTISNRGRSLSCAKFPIVIIYNSTYPYDVSQTTQIYLGKTLGFKAHLNM